MAGKTNYTMNGKDYFRISASFGRDANGKLIRKYFYGKNEKDAKRKVEEYKDNLKKGLIIGDKAYLSTVMGTWLFEIARNNIKPTTFDNYEELYRLYVKESPLAYTQLKDIKGIDIQKYYNELNKKGKSTDRIKNVHKLLKQFMNYALNEGYTLRNPCNGITIPGKIDEIKKEVEVFSHEELKIMLNCNEESAIKDITLICLSTGIRRGEALGLKWGDIDTENREMHIKRNVATTTIIDGDIRHKQQIILTPKTKSSVRSIPLSKTLIPILKGLEIRQMKNKLKAGESYNKEYDGFIFLTQSGNLINSGNIALTWKRFLNRLGIEYKKFHTLRHTYATLQFEAGRPLKTVSKLLGHSKIDITADTYTHVLKKEKEKALDILDVLKMC